MPQDMNSASKGLSDTSWSKATSDSTQEDVAGVGSRAGEQGDAAMGAIKQGARSLGDQAKERASRYVEGGKEAVTEHLDAFAQAIKRASDELSEKDQTMAAQLVRQAAGGLESLSRSIGGASIEDMIGSVRSFGRSNPTAFIGGAVLAGLALGRFARASSHHEADEWRRTGSGFGGSGGQSGSGSFGSASGSNFGSGGGSSYGPGERSSFTPAMPSGTGAPSSEQGYAGGGMGADPIQSSGQPTIGSAGPSSDTDVSDTTSSFSGSSTGSSSMSTGEKS